MDQELISTVSARAGCSPPLWSVFFVHTEDEEGDSAPVLESVVLQSASVDVNLCFRTEDLTLANRILRWLEKLPLAIQKSLREEKDEREVTWKSSLSTKPNNRLAFALEEAEGFLDSLRLTEEYHKAAGSKFGTFEGYGYCFLRDDNIEADWLDDYYARHLSKVLLSDLLAACAGELKVLANRRTDEDFGRACHALGILSSLDAVTDGLKLLGTFASKVAKDFPRGAPSEEYLRGEARLWTADNNLKVTNESLAWKFRRALIHH